MIDFEKCSFKKLKKLHKEYGELSKTDEILKKIEIYYANDYSSDTNYEKFNNMMEGHFVNERNAIKEMFGKYFDHELSKEETNKISTGLVFSFIKRKMKEEPKEKNISDISI